MKFIAFCFHAFLLSAFGYASPLHPSMELELQKYSARVSVLHGMLIEECPEEKIANQIFKRQAASELELQKVLLEGEKKLLLEIVHKIIECRKQKTLEENGNSTAQQHSTTVPTTVQPASTSNSSLATLTLYPECSTQNGSFTTSIDFINFHNPSDNKATGVKCDDDATSCDLYFEICISKLGLRDCGLFNVTTARVSESNVVVFSSVIGAQTNPVIVQVNGDNWTGININIKVWDEDQNKVSDDLVDEFTYNFVDTPGSRTRNIELQSARQHPKSRLNIAARVSCPGARIATTTTAPTVTTRLNVGNMIGCQNRPGTGGCPCGGFYASMSKTCIRYANHSATTWEAAKSLCEHSGEHLLTLETTAKSNWFVNNLSSGGFPSEWVTELWLGGKVYNNTSVGTWHGRVESEISSFNWHNSHSQNGHCHYLRVYSGGWDAHDACNSGIERQFVCEHQL